MNGFSLLKACGEIQIYLVSFQSFIVILDDNLTPDYSLVYLKDLI